MKIWRSVLYRNSPKKIVQVKRGMWAIHQEPDWKNYGANYFARPEEKAMSIATIVDMLNEQVALTKEAIQEYLTNKAIPLEDRWELFKKAKLFQNHDSWSVTFKSLEPIGGNDIFGPDGPIYADRHQEIYTIDMVSNFEHDMAKPYQEFHHKLTRELIDNFKEEILAKNLGSFTFDW